MSYVKNKNIYDDDWPRPKQRSRDDRANRRQLVFGVTIACALMAWLTWLFVMILR